MKKLFPLLTLACAALLLWPACKKSTSPTGEAAGAPPVIGFMPKSKGNAYFITCRKGAEEAARELGVKLLWDGPTDPDPAKQSQLVETWITRGVSAIAVACENREGIATALRKARDKGIKVVTYDADTLPESRDFFCNQATPQGIGEILMAEAAKATGGAGEYAIITGSLTASNMNEWQKHIAEANTAKFPDLKLVALRPCDDIKDKAFSEATALINAHPNLKLILAICSPAVPAAAEAVKQASKQGQVKVVGLGLPNENKRYVKEGVTDAVILWNVTDLGYLAVQAANALATGQLSAGAKELQAGRLGAIRIEGTDLILGKPFVFTKENIDQFDF